jgi:hypothetical protein
MRLRPLSFADGATWNRCFSAETVNQSCGRTACAAQYHRTQKSTRRTFDPIVLTDSALNRSKQGNGPRKPTIAARVRNEDRALFRLRLRAQTVPGHAYVLIPTDD